MNDKEIKKQLRFFAKINTKLTSDDALDIEKLAWEIRNKKRR